MYRRHLPGPRTTDGGASTIGGPTATRYAGVTQAIENPYALTPFPTTGRCAPQRITWTLLAAAAALSASILHGQEPAEPVPAPVVRIQRRPAVKTAPGPGQSASTPALTPAAPLSQALPVTHRSRPAVTPGGVSTPSTGQTTGATSTTSPAPAHPRVHPTLPQTPPSPATTVSGAVPPTPAAPAKATKPAPEHPSNTIHGLNRNVIVIDPGHGGTDSGARIGDTTLEKNVTLALAFRLRSLLLARGFTVVLTRDGDAATMQTTPNAAPTPLTLDDRAGIANHAHAAACLLLHATGRGTGLHIYSSEIAPIPAEPYLVPWLTGQAAWMPASHALEAGLSAALGRSGITLLASTASVRPVDSLTCPALVLELAPETDSPTSINDAGYQERVAAALAGALVVWENAVQPPPRLPAPLRPVHHSETADTPSTATATPEAQP